jgi:ribonucleoside-diphosphate reductase alpha chain
MALQYGVPLITLVDKFRHARFEPAGMTSNRDIPFAKSLIDYIFCWLGCQFIPGYAEQNTPNRTVAATPENKNVTTARQVVEKTRDLAQKIAEVKAEVKVADQAKVDDEDEGCEDTIKPSRIVEIPGKYRYRLVVDGQAGLTGDRAGSTPDNSVRGQASSPRAGALVATGVADKGEDGSQSDAAMMQQFNAQFEHFQDDAPACDICGSITVRNGTCYKCFNCGNSMGCS